MPNTGMNMKFSALQAARQSQAVSMIRGLGRRLVVSALPAQAPHRLNPSSAPLGMLDVERITRVAAPIAAITTRPHPKRSRW